MKKVVITLNLPDKLIAEIDKRKGSVSRSAYITLILENHFKATHRSDEATRSKGNGGSKPSPSQAR